MFFSNNITSSQLQSLQNDLKLSLIVLIFGIRFYTIYDHALYNVSSHIEVANTSFIYTDNPSALYVISLYFLYKIKLLLLQILYFFHFLLFYQIYE